MLTRQGLVVLFAGAAAIIIGRIFAVIELFVKVDKNWPTTAKALERLGY